MAKISQEKLDSYAGRSGVMTVPVRNQNDIYVPVAIIQARSAWGRLDYLVTPEGGEGEAWVNSKNVKLRKLEAKEQPV